MDGDTLALQQQQQLLDRQPVAPVVAVSALVLLLSFAFLYSSKAPFHHLCGLLEMVQFKLSQLASKGGFGALKEIDWDSLPPVGSAAVDSSSDDASLHFDSDDNTPGASRRLSVSAGNGLYYPGLLNAAGNLCFLNATLQSIASHPPLITYLRHIKREAARLGAPAPPVSSTLLLTLDTLNTPTKSPRPLRPVELATALARSSKSRMQLLRSNDQQDAHELWIMIHGAVQEEAARLEARARAEHGPRGLADILSSSVIAHSDTNTEIKANKRRKLNDPYMLLTSQQVKCMICGYTRDVRHIAEDQIVLSVPFNSCSLTQLLAEYTKPELISEYACRACSVLATRQKLHAQLDRLSSAPPEPHHHDANNGNNGSAGTTMTASRKERKRKVARQVELIDRLVASRDFERDPNTLSSSQPAPGSASSSGSGTSTGIKMERATGPAAKQVRLARPGPLVAFHLNRSTHFGMGMGAGGAYKNSSSVSFDEYLDLRPFCDVPPSQSESSESTQEDGFTRVGVRQGKRRERDDSTASATEEDGSEESGLGTRDRWTYRLASLVVHYGTHSFGHYVAFRRVPPRRMQHPSAADNDDDDDDSEGRGTGVERERWFRISDETVDECSIETVLGSNPFLLFYERVEGHAPPSGGSLGTVAGSSYNALTRESDDGSPWIVREAVQRWQVQ